MSKHAENPSPCQCGSTEFSQVKMRIEIEAAGIDRGVKTTALWMRTCGVCGHVTLWSKPAGK
jgi:hypothetical protein